MFEFIIRHDGRLFEKATTTFRISEYPYIIDMIRMIEKCSNNPRSSNSPGLNEASLRGNSKSTHKRATVETNDELQSIHKLYYCDIQSITPSIIEGTCDNRNCSFVHVLAKTQHCEKQRKWFVFAFSSSTKSALASRDEKRAFVCFSKNSPNFVEAYARPVRVRKLTRPLCDVTT